VSTKTKIAFGCYVLVILVQVGAGLRYATASQIMPYHQQVTGMAWADLEPGVQRMFLAFIRAYSYSILGFALALGVLLVVPFRRGDRWARWAIPVVGLGFWLPVLFGATRLAASSGAATPWRGAIIPIVLLIAGFLLSGDLGKGRLED
jgi:hypothetical protein